MSEGFFVVNKEFDSDNEIKSDRANRRKAKAQKHFSATNKQIQASVKIILKPISPFFAAQEKNNRVGKSLKVTRTFQNEKTIMN